MSGIVSSILREAEGAPSLAAYFAAHAPANVPHWYTQLHAEELMERPEPKVPALADAEDIVGRPLSQDEGQHLASWIRDPCWDLEGDLEKFQEATEKARAAEARDAWEYQKMVFFMWRLFYGNMMASMFEDDEEQGS